MIPWTSKPLPGWQEDFVNSDEHWQEVYLGRGAGKTEALIMATVRACQTPGVRALIMAPNYPQLSFIIERVIRWAENVEGIEWDYRNQELRFPNGSAITFLAADRLPPAPSIVIDFLGVDNVEMMDLGWEVMRTRLRGKKLPVPQVRVTENRRSSGIGCDDPNCPYKKNLDNSS